MNENEKDNVYRQMSSILEQVQGLMKTYEDWKNYLLGVENESQHESKRKVSTKKFSQEIESQKYFSREGLRFADNSYKTIALRISAILKEKGVPLSTRQIHELLLDDEITSISYSNLSNNILRRAHKDPKINLERAARGYWQYRLKNL